MKALLCCLAVLSCLVLTASADTLVVRDGSLSLDIPAEWKQVAASGDALVQAQTPDRRVRMFLRKTSLDPKAKMNDPKFQAAVRQALVPAPFTQVVRSEVTKVAGKDAYLLEVNRTAPADAVLAIVFPHQGAMHSLTFLSMGKPLTGNTNIQGVVQSVKALK